jgi:hypothetical protein
MHGSAWAVVFGTTVGALGAPFSVWLTHYLGRSEEARLNANRKSLLKSMLTDDKYEWRSLVVLSHVVGADEEKTKRLLLELSARASEDGTSKWALISRVGLPNEEK